MRKLTSKENQEVGGGNWYVAYTVVKACAGSSTCRAQAKAAVVSAVTSLQSIAVN